jgi:hypothetical protein
MRPEDYQSDYRAATELPSQPPPKPPKGGGLTIPGWRTTVQPGKALINRQTFNVTNTDLTTYRGGGTTFDVVRSFSRVNPELAASQAAHNRVGIPEKFIAIARDPDGTFNVDATRLMLQLLRQMNTMPDYINGFSQVGSLRSVSEALARQMQQTGEINMEMVLDKARIPSHFAPIPTAQIFWFEDGKGTRPVQRIGGQDIDLDIATFFSVRLDTDLLDAYSQSPLESAIQPVLGSTTFLNDLRRVCQRAVYPRIDISIAEEKLRARLPQSVRNDSKKLAEELNNVIDNVTEVVNSIGVEEAMVHFDFFEYKYVEGTQQDMSKTFAGVQQIYNSKMGTAMKTPATILGHGASSATAASADILLFMMNANGMIRLKLQEIYSKALTLAARLLGQDVTVEFEFDEIELRPKSELAAYRQMEKEYWRGLLSDGMVTDEEVCLRLTGNLPPKGYKPRMGTYFMDGTSPETAANPDSQTSNMGSNRNKAPEQAKGPAK